MGNVNEVMGNVSACTSCACMDNFTDKRTARKAEARSFARENAKGSVLASAPMGMAAFATNPHYSQDSSTWLKRERVYTQHLAKKANDCFNVTVQVTSPNDTMQGKVDNSSHSLHNHYETRQQNLDKKSLHGDNHGKSTHNLRVQHHQLQHHHGKSTPNIHRDTSHGEFHRTKAVPDSQVVVC